MTSIRGGLPVSCVLLWPVVTWLKLRLTVLGVVTGFGIACPALSRVNIGGANLIHRGIDECLY